MKKIVILVAVFAFALFFNVYATKVYSFEENFNSAPATNWGFSSVTGHSWNYESVNQLEQFRWSASSYSTKALSSTVLPANSTDGKTITVEIIAKFYTIGNTGAAGSFYVMDDANNAIFGITLARNSSAWQLGRATTCAGLATPAAKPTITDFLNSDQPTVKITATLDFTAKTYSYQAQLGTFDYMLRVFTASGTSVSTSGNAFISASAANIKTFLSNYFKSATSGNYTPNGYDLMYLGISNDISSPATTDLTIQFKDQNNETVKTEETVSNLVVGNLYNAIATQRASIKNGSYYYALDLSQPTSTKVAVGTPLILKYRKTAIYSTMNWAGTATTSGGLWSDYYQNFNSGGTATGSQMDAALTFGSATNKSVTLLEAINLGSGSCTVNSAGYSFSGNYGSINGTGALNINLTGTDAFTLNTTNNLTGTTQISGGTITVNKAGSLGLTPNITGATTIISGVGQSFPSLTFSASSNIQGSSYVNSITGMSASSGVKIAISSSHNTANDYAFDFAASGTLSSGSELELTGTAVETKFGMTTANSSYLANTKVSLKGSAFLFIDVNQGAASTINVGTLSGESGTKLGWGKSSALDRHITWSVGANNENSEFAGTITNLGGYAGSGSFYTGQYTHLTKVGTGKLILSGTSYAYNGNLTVNGGEVLVSGTLQGNNQPGTDKALPNSVTVAPNAKLSVTGSLTATNLVINSDITGTGTLVNTGTVTITNPATVKQYLSAARNWYISSPVSGATVPTGSTYYYYDETQKIEDTDGDHFIAVAEGTELIPGKGYIAKPAAATTLSFTGSLNDGDKSIVLTRQGATKAGFNLVGNPYPSYIDAGILLSANRPEGAEKVESNIWYRTANWDNGQNKFIYQFQTYNASSDETVPQAANPSYIHPMQCFWVRALTDGVELNFTNAMRKHNETTSPILLRAKAASDRQRLRLQVNNGTTTDEALIYFDTNASNAFDRYDASKFSEPSTVTQIFTTAGNEKLVINGMNSMPLDSPIGLGFVAGNATSFSIVANEITNLPSDVRVILIDNAKNGLETDLTDGVTAYEFTPATTSGDRFSIIFRSPGVTTGVDNAEKVNVNIYVNATGQIVINAPVNSRYAIYNAVGQAVAKGETAHTSYMAPRCNAGVYMVEVNNEVKKVIVR